MLFTCLSFVPFHTPCILFFNCLISFPKQHIHCMRFSSLESIPAVFHPPIDIVSFFKVCMLLALRQWCTLYCLLMLSCLSLRFCIDDTSLFQQIIQQCECSVETSVLIKVFVRSAAVMTWCKCLDIRVFDAGYLCLRVNHDVIDLFSCT